MKITKTLVLFFSVIALAGQARAQGHFAKKHPRRAEVLHRDRHLENRTERAEKNGKITEAQADHLESEEAAIHQQEQAAAAAHGGHITKREQKHLNREENHVRRELRRDIRKDAHEPAPVSAPAAQ